MAREELVSPVRDVASEIGGLYKLYYSNGSPYARRVRILLIEKGISFLSDVDDRLRPIEDIEPLNPALQVPVLEIDGLRLFDSSVIARYIYASYPHDPHGETPLAPSIVRPDRRWDDELVLAVIEALTGSIVGLRLHLGADEEAVPFIKRQRYRVGSCLDWLEKHATPEGYWPGTFSVMDLNALCAVAFAERRGVLDFDRDRWPVLGALLSLHARRRSVMQTPVNELAA